MGSEGYRDVHPVNSHVNVRKADILFVLPGLSFGCDPLGAATPLLRGPLAAVC